MVSSCYEEAEKVKQRIQLANQKMIAANKYYQGSLGYDNSWSYKLFNGGAWAKFKLWTGYAFTGFMLAAAFISLLSLGGMI
jgi:hypothetical protein